MTPKWVIMVWLTQNPTSAWHAASADQSNALLQSQLPTKSRITVARVYIQRYNRIHWHQSCSDKAAAGGCLCPVQAPASSQCLHTLAVPAPPSQCSWHQLKHTGKPKARVKARRRRSKANLKQSKTLKLQVRNSLRNRIEAQSASLGPKQAWKHKVWPQWASKLEALIEVRILDFNTTVYCKCQQHNSISKELSRGSDRICNIEYSRQNFGLSWFQLKGLLKDLLISIVENRTQQPETAS